MPEPAEILFCHCAYADVLPEQARRLVPAGLCASEAEVRSVPDLCELAARGDALLKQLAGAPSLKIVACFPRAVKWLFAAAGAPLDDDRVEMFNMRTQTPEEILDALAPDRPPAGGQPERPASPANGEWMPWFPVIDYDRCAGCGQCMNFCLFGVYEAAPDGRVEVRNPTHCKTGCPACARMCPEAAIIFPKYSGAPINGDEPDQAHPDGQSARVDVPALLGEDIYAALRQRGGPGGAQLDRIQKSLDIPDEVLNSLGAGRDGSPPPDRTGQAG